MLDHGMIEILQNCNKDKVDVISPVFRIPEPIIVKYDGSKKKISPALVIKSAGPVPYSSDKAVPYRYNTVILKDGKEPKSHEDVVKKTVVNPAGPMGTSSSNPTTVVKGVDPVVDKSVKAPVLSKVEVRKRKERESSDSEEDVEDDVLDITPAKKQVVKKSSGKAAVVHLDNISFHLEDGAAKSKFVIQMRVAIERQLGKEAVEVKEVMELIKVAGLMKTVVGLPQCYEGLVKEFIVNIPEDISEKRSREYSAKFL
ncbi:uncharacterized protein LOC127130995 [Lathyrus oleraceus]|uniref:uncharacterized protein LOC127130995 n=1 Tax=Pisum sativum TaxID=3888 RepID=UPI0021D235CD|nr:uncharacterized protein LOC127130995 [Pisum sativum]